MKTKHLKLGSAILSATLTMALFNNFSFVALKLKSTLESVHEASRVSHAKELLGSKYLSSPAAKLEGQTSLSSHIESTIEDAIPDKYKSQSPAIARTIIKESKRYKLDPVFVLAIIETESKFNPDAIGSVGEMGLMQIRPETAAWICHKLGLKWTGKESLLNPHTNIKISLAYMNFLRTHFTHKPASYVNAYNMGPTNVKRLLAQNKTPNEYKSRVMKNYKTLYNDMMDAQPKVLSASL